MRFEELNLIEPILKAVKEEGYTVPTPIQEQAIPVLLENRDLVGCAQTGTGKTAAFAIPILQRLAVSPRPHTHKKSIRALILTPTRELALQIGESLSCYGRHLPLKTAVIFGGVSQVSQTDAVRRGIDILVATPGRLLDLIGQKHIELHHLEIFVLDEADRMLDMGFAPDVKRVIGMLPEIRQNMLFSATMPPEITKLVDKLLNEPAKVSVTPVSSTVDAIAQSVYFVGKKEKRLLLVDLLKNEEMRSVLIFSRTKHGADRITRDLVRAGIPVAAIHGDKSQNNRVAALTSFKNKKIRVLVATDIAARGIDVDDLSHVVNFDLPNVPETYIHRIGRTGRAGLDGIAISFCDEEEKAYLKDIQKLMGKQVPVMTGHAYPLENYVAPEPVEQPDRNRRNRQERPARAKTVARASSPKKHVAPPAKPHTSERVQASSSADKIERDEKSRPVGDGSRIRPDSETFERMAKLLDSRHGRGGARKRRETGASGQAPANTGARDARPPQPRGGRKPRQAESLPEKRNKDHSTRTTRESERNTSEKGNNLRAAENPGPFEQSSFLTRPLKSRPKGL